MVAVAATAVVARAGGRIAGTAVVVGLLLLLAVVRHGPAAAVGRVIGAAVGRHGSAVGRHGARKGASPAAGMAPRPLAKVGARLAVVALLVGVWIHLRHGRRGGLQAGRTRQVDATKFIITAHLQQENNYKHTFFSALRQYF